MSSVLQLLFYVFLVLFTVDGEEPLQTIIRYTRPKCRTDADCHNRAFCFGNDNNVIGYCKCLDGYEMFVEGKYYECLAALKLGEKCRRDLQCQITAGPLSICSGYDDQKFCTCNSTIAHSTNNKECFETKYLGEFCLVDENCLLPENTIDEYKYGMCHFGVCSCPLGKIPSKSRKRCIEFRKMDEKCTSDIECQAFTANSVCRTVCTCETGFTISSDRQRCLKAGLKFGDPCMENDQCSKYLTQSICKNRVCSCPIQFHDYRTECRRDVKPGEACFDDGDCIISKTLRGEVKCNKGVCECLHGKSYDDKICLQGGAFTSTINKVLLVVCVNYVIYIYKFIY